MSLEKILILGKIEGKKEKGVAEDEMVRQHLDSLDMNLSKLQDIAKDGEVWHAAVHGFTKNWT